MSGSIGERVRDALTRVGLSQKQLAETVDMKQDALSNALNGKRSFAAAELALIAPVVRTSVDWLISGQHGPFEPKLSARHEYQDGQGHAEHDWAKARGAVSDVVLAYQQVGFEGSPVQKVKERVAARAASQAREQLVAEAGPEFVIEFADAIERTFGIHVFVLGPRENRLADGRVSPFVSVPEDHAYAGEVNGQQFIIVSAGGAWYRKNFALAHELGHLLSGDPRYVDEAENASFDEYWANAFASELLLPADLIGEVDWNACATDDIARWILAAGVSTQALNIALRSKLGISLKHLGVPTISLVRNSAAAGHFADFDAKFRAPRFPRELVLAHDAAVESGVVPPDVLAWMLGVQPGELLPLGAGDSGEFDFAELAEALDL